jgi:RNA polymerase sigma-70 factor (ECF subfamily)
MTDNSNQEHFIGELTENQNRVFAYICTLLGDPNRARDVLQETNLVLWRKSAEFKKGDNFIAWAFAIARYQVLAHLRNKQRDRFVLDPELIGLVSDVVEKEVCRMSAAQPALRTCLAKLPDDNRQLIELRYFKNMRIKDIANTLQRSLSAIKVSLMRIRRSQRDGRVADDRRDRGRLSACPGSDQASA